MKKEGGYTISEKISNLGWRILISILVFIPVLASNIFIFSTKNDPDFPLTIALSICISAFGIICCFLLNINQPGLLKNIGSEEAKSYLKDIIDVYKSAIVGLGGLIGLLWGLTEAANWDFLRLQTYSILSTFAFITCIGFLFIFIPMRKIAYPSANDQSANPARRD